MKNLILKSTRQRVKVSEIAESQTKTGETIALYADMSENYYFCVYNGFIEELEKLGTFEDEEKAKEAFIALIAEM